MYAITAIILSFFLVSFLSKSVFYEELSYVYIIPIFVGVMLSFLFSPIVIEQLKDAGHVTNIYEDEENFYALTTGIIAGIFATVSGLCWAAITNIDLYEKEHLSRLRKIVFGLYTAAGALCIISIITLAISSNDTIIINMDDGDVDVTNVVIFTSSLMLFLSYIMSSVLYVVGLPLLIYRIFRNSTFVRKLLIFISSAIVSYALSNYLGFESKEIIALSAGSIIVISVSIWGET